LGIQYITTIIGKVLHYLQVALVAKANAGIKRMRLALAEISEWD